MIRRSYCSTKEFCLAVAILHLVSARRHAALTSASAPLLLCSCALCMRFASTFEKDSDRIVISFFFRFIRFFLSYNEMVYSYNVQGH